MFILLRLDFSADLADIIIDGEKVNDMLYTGIPFEVSMRYHGFPREICVRLHPLLESDTVYLEKIPKYNSGVACSLDGIEISRIECEYFHLNNEL